MLAEADLPLRVVGPGAFIDYLGPQDEPWLRVLVEEWARFSGRRRREITTRLSEPLPCEAPYFKRRCATRILLRTLVRTRSWPVAPALARRELFETATARCGARAELLSAAAQRLGTQPEALEELLFADLDSERKVVLPERPPSAAELALKTNLAIAQTVVMRASRVTLDAFGQVRPIVRLAKLRGLMCALLERSPESNAACAPNAEPVGAAGATFPAATLEISGPFSLFRHTLLYGRALAELIPHLAWCARFELVATVSLRGRLLQVRLASGDPIFPGSPPQPFDSQLERRFAEDFARIAPDWDLVREPEALRAGRTLVFPDFLLRHRIFADQQVLVELVGFWTQTYLRQKLARLAQAGVSRLILCIDERRGCDAEVLSSGLPVVPYRRRVDPHAVLELARRLVEAPAATTTGSPPRPR